MDEPRRPTHRQVRIEQSPLDQARVWVEILAFLAAGCWAIYTFIYETKIAPAFLPAHEVVSLNVQRLAETPSAYIERVEVTIRNDGIVDVDTAAYAEDLYGAESSAFSNLRSDATSDSAEYGSLVPAAWKIVQSSGELFDGAIAGRRGSHLILHPGDSLSLQIPAVVPRSYRVLRAYFQARYDRYPISPRIDITLARRAGTILLKSNYTSIGFDSYFGV